MSTSWPYVSSISIERIYLRGFFVLFFSFFSSLPFLLRTRSCSCRGTWVEAVFPNVANHLVRKEVLHRFATSDGPSNFRCAHIRDHPFGNNRDVVLRRKKEEKKKRRKVSILLKKQIKGKDSACWEDDGKAPSKKGLSKSAPTLLFREKISLFSLQSKGMIPDARNLQFNLGKS